MTVLFDRQGFRLTTGLRVRAHDKREGVISELDPDGYVIVTVDGDFASTLAYRPDQLTVQVRREAQT